MESDSAWKERVGGDTWKNVIMLECEAVKDALTKASTGCDSKRFDEQGASRGQDPFSRATTGHMKCDASARLTQKTLRSSAFSHEVVVEDRNPDLRSFLVWQTGRLFVVGPGRKALERVKAISRIEETRRRRHNERQSHIHIVLLNWAKDHREKLADFLDLFGERVTIWTSYWIWDEVLRSEGDALRGFGSTQPFDPWTDGVIPGENACPAGTRHEPGGEHGPVVALFERSAIWHPTAGVSFGMSYSLGETPCLRADFQCNHQSLTLDPALDGLGASDISSFAAQLHSNLLTETRRKGPETYAEHSLDRLHELLDRFSPSRLPKGSEPHISFSCFRTDGVGFPDPVDLSLVGATMQEFKVRASKNREHVPDRRSPTVAASGETDAVLAETAVMILCGGLANKAEWELVDPGYGLDLGADDRTPILDMHLNELVNWVSGKPFKLPVILLTTPETRDVVAGCLSRFEAHRNRGAGTNHKSDTLDIFQVAAQLVPALTNATGSVAMSSDGGWRLSARGHMDALRLLARLHQWETPNEQARKSGEDEFGRLAQAICGKKYAMIVAFNNLGRIFDEEATANISKLATSGADIALELFAWRRPAEKEDRSDETGAHAREMESLTDDSRWPLLSYTENPRDPLLVKKSYLGRLPRPRRDGLVCYSSLTWYVRLTALDKAFDRAVQAIGFGISPDEQCIGGNATRRFQHIDFATHLPGIKCLGILEKGMTSETKNSPYRYTRFLGIRTQDHVREPSFTKVLRETVVAAQLPEPAFELSPVMVAWPKHQEYLWGGREIATLKGLHGIYRQMRLAETGEISTLDGYPSQVVVNAHAKLSLRHVVGQPVPFMVKYLDCHDALSLQVHGLPRTERLDTSDMNGKEESFLVLRRAPGRKVNLFLGFERTSIRPVAEAVRSILQHPRPDVKVTERVLRKILKSLIESMNANVVEGARQYVPDLKIPDFQPSMGMIEVLRRRIKRKPLAGNEYLVAGIALIDYIRQLRYFLGKLIGESQEKHRSDTVEAARKLFGAAPESVVEQGLDSGDGGTETHPLLRFFHRVSLPHDNCWVRIPPGIVHSWQGGGNFLIEVAHRSDSTLRIMDFGREFVGPGRPMHYWKAMDAIFPDGFFEKKTGERLIVAADENDPERIIDCHSLLSCRRSPTKLERSGGWFFLMNPDGPMDVIAREASSHTKVERCRTVLVKPGTQIEVMPDGPNNRVFQFLERSPDPPLLFLCLGASQWNALLWRDQRFPAIKPMHSPETNDVRSAIQAVLNRAYSEERLVEVAVAWPGYTDSLATRLFSTQLSETRTEYRRSDIFGSQSRTKDFLLSDFQAAVLGEVSHKLGGLNPDEPGAIINLERGVCIGFYLPRKGGDRMIRLIRDERVTVCSGVGRWLYLREGTGEIRRADELEHIDLGVGRIDRLVFGVPLDHSGDRTKNGDIGAGWTRASKYFTAYPNVGSRGVAEPRAIANYANDLAGMIRQVAMSLEHQARASEGPLERDDLFEIRDKCLRNIVLTGQIGQYLPGGGHSAGDILVETLQTRLSEIRIGSTGKLGEMCSIKRSEIATSAEREIEGFLYYRKLLRQSPR